MGTATALRVGLAHVRSAGCGRIGLSGVGNEGGPPIAVIVVGAGLGLVTLLGVWRGSSMANVAAPTGHGAPGRKAIGADGQGQAKGQRQRGGAHPALSWYHFSCADRWRRDDAPAQRALDADTAVMRIGP